MDNLAMEHSMKLVVVLLILVAHLFFIAPGFSVDVVEQRRPTEVSSLGEIHMQPIGETEYRIIEADVYHARRRRLDPYQLCFPCKCCSTTSNIISNNTFCATMPCCFGIDCQLPDKPFGVCAFVPKTCNCTSCATAT